MKTHRNNEKSRSRSNADYVGGLDGKASFMPPTFQLKGAEEEEGKELSDRVGEQGANHAADVRLVQGMLHRARLLSKKDMEAEYPADKQCSESDCLAETALPQTIAAIIRFEQEIGRTDTAGGGCITPNGPNWQALQKAANKNAFTNEDADSISLNISDPDTILYIEADDWIHAIPLADLFPHATGEVSLNKQALAEAFGVNLPDRLYTVAPDDEYFHLIKALLPNEPEVCAGSLGGNLAILVEIFQQTLGQIPAGEWAPPGRQPIPLYIGRKVHEAIGIHYRLNHFASRGKLFLNDRSFTGILGHLNQKDKLSKLSTTESLLRPDIYDAHLEQLYEIKPAKYQQQAVTKMLNYIRILHNAGMPVRPGATNDLGARGAVPAPGGVATFFSPVPGVILYRMNKLKKDPVTQPVPKPIMEPQPHSPDFLQYMEEVTGLVGTALIVYIIISEGSRLFPPRNLIPIP